MPGTRNDFGQMFDHELNPRKGWSGDRGMALEKTLPISNNTNKVSAGAVVYIDDNGEFKLGVPSTAVTGLTQGKPPLFAFQNENDFDVNPDLGNIAGGVLMALSCLGSFELESTEYDSVQTYLPGTYLTADDGSATPSAASGQLTVGALTTDIICGIVSEIGSNADGSFENDHGQNIVRFWTWYCPAEIDATA